MVCAPASQPAAPAGEQSRPRAVLQHHVWQANNYELSIVVFVRCWCVCLSRQLASVAIVARLRLRFVPSLLVAAAKAPLKIERQRCARLPSATGHSGAAVPCYVIV